MRQILVEFKVRAITSAPKFLMLMICITFIFPIATSVSADDDLLEAIDNSISQIEMLDNVVYVETRTDGKGEVKLKREVSRHGLFYLQKQFAAEELNEPSKSVLFRNFRARQL